jgi:hypothetical protein
MRRLMAFFFSGRSSVMVTIPAALVTLMVSIPPTIISAMGLNPYRPQQRRASDYLFVAAALAVALALVLWALLG